MQAAVALTGGTQWAPQNSPFAFVALMVGLLVHGHLIKRTFDRIFGRNIFGRTLCRLSDVNHGGRLYTYHTHRILPPHAASSERGLRGLTSSISAWIGLADRFHNKNGWVCSGSEAGTYVRLIDDVYHSTQGLRVIKKKKIGTTDPGNQRPVSS